MVKFGVLLFLSLVVLSTFAAAHEARDFGRAITIIDSRMPCSSLNENDLEALGEFYVEQMHPGESHDVFHERIGLIEGTEEEEQFHMNVARRMYCNENIRSASFQRMYGMMTGAGTPIYISFAMVVLAIAVAVLAAVMFWLLAHRKTKRH